MSRRHPDDRPIFIRQGWPQAMSHLPEIDGQAPCYPAFSLVGLLRKSYKDGVNAVLLLHRNENHPE